MHCFPPKVTVTSSPEPESARMVRNMPDAWHAFWNYICNTYSHTYYAFIIIWMVRQVCILYQYHSLVSFVPRYPLKALHVKNSWSVGCMGACIRAQWRASIIALVPHFIPLPAVCGSVWLWSGDMLTRWKPRVWAGLQRGQSDQGSWSGDGGWLPRWRGELHSL